MCILSIICEAHWICLTFCKAYCTPCDDSEGRYTCYRPTKPKNPSSQSRHAFWQFLDSNSYLDTKTRHHEFLTSNLGSHPCHWHVLSTTSFPWHPDPTLATPCSLHNRTYHRLSFTIVTWFQGIAPSCGHVTWYPNKRVRHHSQRPPLFVPPNYRNWLRTSLSKTTPSDLPCLDLLRLACLTTLDCETSK